MRRVILIFLAAFLVAGTASAACAVEAISRLIAADAGLVLEIPRAERELSRIAESALLDRICGSMIFKDWKGGRHYRELDKIRETVEQLTGKPFRETFNELLGRDVVLAIFPHVGGEVSFVFLTRVVDSATLSEAVAIWDRASKHPITKSPYRGYSIRAQDVSAESDKKVSPLYWAQLDAVFALSETESEIRRVIDLYILRVESQAGAISKPPAPAKKLRSIADEEVYRRFREVASPKSIATMFVNPRPWDPLLEEAAQADAFGKTLYATWRHVESIGWEVQLNHSALVSATIRYRMPEQSAGWQRYLERLRGRPEFLKRIPQDALLVFAGRHDVAGGMSVMMDSVLDKRERGELEEFRRIARGLLLGRDLFTDVLPVLKPNYGGYVIASPQARPGEMPVCFVGAVALPQPESTTGDQPALRTAIDNAVNTWMNYLAAMHNSRPARMPILVKTPDLKNMTLRWMSGLKTTQPTYALTSGHFVIGSSWRAVNDFAKLRPADSLAAAPHFSALAKDYFSDSDQVLYVNLVQMRKFVQDQRVVIAAKIAAAHSLSPQQAEQRLERLDNLLQMFDAAFFAVKTGEDAIRLTLGGAYFDAAAH